MNNEILKQIIEQVKRYKLSSSFVDTLEFQKWILKLNSTQIENFLSLDIELEQVKDIRHLLINNDLLNCKDYKQKVATIATLKNGEGCWNLYQNICSPNFLKSKNFYKDIEMLSKADTARYGLWILNEEAFINSPYHDEDLKLVVETHDTNTEKPLDYIVSDALATVASDINSIKSSYHQADMKLIAKVGSNCLQGRNIYPEQSVNNLAVNKVSLADKYHLENMKILANNPLAREFLYIIMTDSKIVNGKYYRKEVEALLNAKSKLTARALYYYIVNPDRKFYSDSNFRDDYGYDMEDSTIVYPECVSGKVDSDYVNNLIKINQIDDKFVMHYVSLLMNPNFINSPYKKFDLELLQIVSCKPIFMDLYMLMSSEESLRSNHHKKDAIMISQTKDDDVRDLLLHTAVDEYNLESSNHAYDMEYVTKLNIESMDKKIMEEIYYYLFNQKGINDLKHKEKLEKLLHGELVERSISVEEYLNVLQNQIDTNSVPVTKVVPMVVNEKPKSRILILFRKNKRK